MAQLDLTKISFADFDRLRQDGLISDDELEMAKRAVGSDFDFDFWQLTVDEFGVIMRGQLPKRVIDLFNVEGISAAEFLRRNNAFERFVEDFCDIMGRMSLKETAEERQASVNLPKFPDNESLLVFAREYFGHKNFTDAGETTLADLYLAKKDSFAKRMFERSMQELMSSKLKRHKK